VPSRLTLVTMNAVHRALIALTRGRAGWTYAGMPVVELTTTGRRTGEARRSMLTSPVTLDGDLVVVASRGGDDRHPAWFLNLEANPDVLVARDGGPAVPMRARVLTSTERAGLWPQITRTYRGYAQYQEKTTREIPLVVLRPAPDCEVGGSDQA
jgi:deazaflavin-dependent oxidoreductase (nitroreductase family)